MHDELAPDVSAAIKLAKTRDAGLRGGYQDSALVDSAEVFVLREVSSRLGELRDAVQSMEAMLARSVCILSSWFSARV